MSVVLITGASSGIGLAAARIMSAAGDQVVGISRSGREGTLQADLSTEEGCQQAYRRIAPRTLPQQSDRGLR